MPQPTLTVLDSSSVVRTINTINANGQANMANSNPVVIASDQSAVPVSGTVTANAGTGNFTVAQATGTNLHTVVDSGSITVSGTVTANAGTGNFTVAQATGTNLHTVVDSGSITVSGTVTANAGTGTLAVSAASLPLPSNAAQETGGKLAAIATSLAPYASIVTSQQKVSVTGTAVQLQSNATNNGITVKAAVQNVAKIFVGSSGVTRTDDGTGNGVALSPGDSWPFQVTNSNVLYVNGTAGDFVYYGGN